MRRQQSSLTPPPLATRARLQGVVSGALLLVAEDLHLTRFEQEAVVSATVAAAVCGALAGGSANQKLGRRPVILVSALLFVAGALLMALSPGFLTLAVGRAVVGLAIGATSTTAPLYIAEASPPELRGTLVSLNVALITGGQAVAGVVDGLLAGRAGGWRWMLGLSAVPAVVLGVGFLPLPESPRWLVAAGRREEAAAALRKLRDREEVGGEVDEIEGALHASQRGPTSWSDLLASAPARRAIALGCALQALQQLCAINTVMYYSAQILTMAGFASAGQAIWLAALVATANFAFTLFGLALIDRVGRRRLTLVSISGVCAALLLLGGAFWLESQRSPALLPTPTRAGHCADYARCMGCVEDPVCGFCANATAPAAPGRCLPAQPGGGAPARGHGFTCPTARWHAVACPGANGWPAVFGLLLYLAFFSPGLGMTPWAMNAEMHAPHLRAHAAAAATATNWVCNLLVSVSFLDLVHVLGAAGAFWLFAAVAACGAAGLFLYLPETKGRSLEEMEEVFARGGPVVGTHLTREAHPKVLSSLASEPRVA